MTIHSTNKRNVSRRQFLGLSGGALAGGLLASSFPSAFTGAPLSLLRQGATEEEILAMDNAATGVPYVVKNSINNGQPITLEYWEWASDRAVYEQQWIEEYMKLYPNVTINLNTQSFDNYWTQLLVNVPAGQGPTLWHMHTSRSTELCDGLLMDPMPAEVADQDFLNRHWVGFAEGAMDCTVGTPGSRQYLPMGIQLPALYINRRLWEEGGMTDADIPKTWEDLRRVAKALAKTDSTGRIVQAGLVADWQLWLQNSVYQLGRYLFTADGKGAQINNDEYRQCMQFIKDLNTVDKVVDPEFPPVNEAFASEQAAMAMNFSFFSSIITASNPDLDFFVALMPTPTGDLPPAYGNLRFAVEAVVNAFATPEQKAVAWDLWHFLYSSDKRVLEDVALRNGFVPPYDKLQSDPTVQANPTVGVIVQAVDYGVVNDVPAVVIAVIHQNLLDPVLLADVPIDQALQDAEQAANDALAQREDWNIIERNYKHNDLMIPNQP
jgi:multiple sugar transport system substrate-binding protein